MKIIIALALLSTPAYAGHCSHGGSSGGGGGGGGSYSSGSSSSSSSSSSSTESKACSETTDIEGYRECVSFGAWADNMLVPPMIISLGTNVRHFSTMIGGESGSVTHGDESFAYRVAKPASARRRMETAMTMAADWTLGIGHGFYAGLEGEIGGLVSPQPLSTEMLSTGTFGSPTIDLTGGMVVGGAGVVGLRGGNSRAAIAAEIAGGVRSVEYRFDSNYHDCEQNPTIGVVGGVVEARARAEVWVSPWVSLGVTVGTSVIDQDDWMAGAYLGLHSRAYGGLR